MGIKVKQTILLLIYYISPIIASAIYWLEEPLDSSDLMNNLIHRTGSILGIFSFVWLCFNILISIRIKPIEKNFSLEKLTKFHTIMAAIALLFMIVHYPLVRIEREYSSFQIRSGSISFLLFITFMVLALIFMTNTLLKFRFIEKLRNFAFRKKFRYNLNKVLHTIMALWIPVIYIHTLVAFTSQTSFLMRGVYSFFLVITLLGWIYHKLIRRFRSKSDPFIHRKASWDVPRLKIIQGQDTAWASELIQKNPSLYPCLQCGTCTTECIISEVSKGDFNPRLIMESSLLGLKDKLLIEKIPNIWDCTTCYACVENCPQKVRTIYDYGLLIPLQNAIVERRKRLGLPPRPQLDIQEIQGIMDLTGFKRLIEEPNIDAPKEEI
jgi:heterodisulfide reductase subunit C